MATNVSTNESKNKQRGRLTDMRQAEGGRGAGLGAGDKGEGPEPSGQTGSHRTVAVVTPARGNRVSVVGRTLWRQAGRDFWGRHFWGRPRSKLHSV